MLRIGTARHALVGALQSQSQEPVSRPQVVNPSLPVVKMATAPDQQVNDPQLPPAPPSLIPTLKFGQPAVVTPTGLGVLAGLALACLLVAAARNEKPLCY